MANWNLPTITSGYIDFVTEMNTKFADAATLQFGSPINLPENTIRFSRSANIFQEWVTGAWVDKVLGVAGGGTGSVTAAGARTNLGIGSMGTQNSNAVAITGGSITGVNYSANDITSGILALARGGTGSSLTLGPQGNVLGSFGGSVVFNSGQGIAELNASSLIAGTVPLARLTGVALLNSPNLFTKSITIQGDSESAFFKYISNVPIMYFDTEPPTVPNRKSLRFAPYDGTFYFQAMTDDATNIMSIMTVDRVNGITGNGQGLTNLNGSSVAFGTVAPPRLGSGVPSSANFLRGDGVWATIAPGEVSPVPSGLIAMFDTDCPAGWTRVSSMDGRFIMGSGSFGATGGSNDHTHSYGGSTSGAGSHSHSFSGSGSDEVLIDGYTVQNQGDESRFFQAGPNQIFFGDHDHRFSYNFPVNIDINGSTDGVGNHNHDFNGSTSNASNIPPYFTVVFCRKN